MKFSKEEIKTYVDQGISLVNSNKFGITNFKDLSQKEYECLIDKIWRSKNEILV